MNAEVLQTTVPSDIGEIIDQLAKEQMVSRDVIIRQFLEEAVRQAEVQNCRSNASDYLQKYTITGTIQMPSSEAHA